MTVGYRIPDSAVKYILMQRTEYFVLIHNIFFVILRNILKIFGKDLDYYSLSKVEAIFRKEKIKNLYLSDMESEYRSIKDFLPKKCTRIMDIGCGVAGIDIFLNIHYSKNNSHFYLLDKSRIDEEIHYMFEKRGSFYDSLEVAREVLVVNGVNTDRIHLIEANDQNTIQINDNIDLALSTISWGFHYPIHVYIEGVHAALGDGGVLIVDIRKGTDGFDWIEDRFGGYRIVMEDEKFVRICAVKQAPA